MRSFVFAASLMFSAPVAQADAPQPKVEIPVDRVARHRFPHDNGKLIDALAFINAVVNAAIQPESDQDHYGVLDYWVMAPADGKGDCEDYAITKFLLIENIDGQPINPVTHMKLVGVMVGQDGHAILAVRLPSGRVMYLDNLNAEPMTRLELQAEGYRFSDWVA
jgi:predicted transglutaminase-like cysteine proteinase